METARDFLERRVRGAKPKDLLNLLTLRDWLQALGVTHVALESTGV